MDREAVNMDMINAQTQVAEYKKQLSYYRTGQIIIVGQLQGLQVEIGGLENSAANLIEMFKSEALAMYPELAGQDIDAILASISNAHPLTQLWDQYSSKLDRVDADLRVKYETVNGLKGTLGEAQNGEAELLASYNQFASSSASPVPSVDELISEMDRLQTIPQVEEGTTVASLPAIEMLNPFAANMVMLQSMQVESEGDYSQSPDQTQNQVSDQPVSMEQAENVQAPSLDDQSPQRQISVFQAGEVLPGEGSGFKPMGIFLGLAGLWYIFSGGKK
jgi:hypothetical protein